MRVLLWLLALSALAVGASLLLNYNESYVLLVAPPYRAEISLSLAIVLLLAGFFAGYALLRVVTLTRSLPKRVRAFRERRQRDRTIETFYDAARLLFEGRFSHAMKKAEEAHDAGYSPALAALLAARSAQRLREHSRMQDFLDRATRIDAKMQPASLMLEAEMLIETQRPADAVVVLKRLQELSGRHIAALRLELRAQQGCGNWDEVLRIARQLEKRKALSPELAREIKLKAHQENIEARRHDRDALNAYRKTMPSGESDARVARLYAAALLELGANGEARAYIESQLDGEWDSALARLYGLTRDGDLTASIARADQWLLAHRDDPELLLALGRLCVAQRLWGKAQTYLEASLSLADRREVRLELARFFEETGRAEAALPHYRAAAEQTA
jgi:HemY protein